MAGARIQIRPADVRENRVDGESPHDLVQRLSALKARSLSASSPDALVLGADTVVVLRDQILEKPSTAEEAKEMLQSLSGRTHTVKTGVTLVHGATNRDVSFVESTEVTFSKLTDIQIDDYIAGGSPFDKAGGYGIQDEGALFVERIEGDFYTVMGLPLNRLQRVLYERFPDLLLHADHVS